MPERTPQKEVRYALNFAVCADPSKQPGPDGKRRYVTRGFSGTSEHDVRDAVSKYLTGHLDAHKLFGTTPCTAFVSDLHIKP